MGFGRHGSYCRLSLDQQEHLKAWIAETMPGSTRAVGLRIEAQFGIDYRSRSGLVALLRRLGMVYRKSDAVKQQAYIEFTVNNSQALVAAS